MLGIWISCWKPVKNRRIILFSLTAISRKESCSDKLVKSSLEKIRSVCYFLCVGDARTPFLSQFHRKGGNSRRGSPVPGVQIVQRGRKIHEERKNEGRLEGERGRELSRSRLPSFSRCTTYLTRPPLTAVLYYLNAWNRLRRGRITALRLFQTYLLT